MDATTTLAAERACADVITRHAMGVNDGDLDACVALFTAGGVWQRAGDPPMIGAVAIRSLMESQPTDRVVHHVNGGILVEVVDEDRASVSTQPTASEAPGRQPLPAPLAGPDMVVEYRDHLVRVGDRWLLARRDARPIVFKAGV